MCPKSGHREEAYEQGNESTVGDLLGIAPVVRAVERVTESVVSGAEALLEEFVFLPLKNSDY
jgi:hypothetical protein